MPKSEMKQKKPKRSETYFLVLWNEAKRKRNVFFALFRFEAKNKKKEKNGTPKSTDRNRKAGKSPSLWNIAKHLPKNMPQLILWHVLFYFRAGDTLRSVMSSVGPLHFRKRFLNNPTLGQEIHWEVWCLQLGHHSLGNAYQRNSHARSETLQCSLYWPCTVRNKVKLEVPCTSLTYCTWWYILYCIVRSEGPCTSWPCQIRNQGWALRSFPFGTLRSFPF